MIKYIKIINLCTDIHQPSNKPNNICCFTSKVEIFKKKQIFNDLEDRIFVKFIDENQISSEQKFSFIINNPSIFHHLYIKFYLLLIGENNTNQVNSFRRKIKFQTFKNNILKSIDLV